MSIKNICFYKTQLEKLKLFGFMSMLTSEIAIANIVGNDAQNFNPAPGKNTFVSVHSTSTLNEGRWNLGLYVNHAVNTLPYETPDSQDRLRVNDGLTGLDLLAGLGVHDRLELGIAVPFVISQSVREDDNRGEFEKRGNTELRPQIKWAFYRGDLAGMALITSVNFNRLVDDPATGNSKKPTYNLELAYDLRLGPATLAANLGYRKRSPEDQIEGSLVEPSESRYLGSIGARLDVTSKAALISEVFGSVPATRFDNESNRQNRNSELLGGLRYLFTENLHADGGISTELNNGLSTPDWRIYGGIVAEFGREKSPSNPLPTTPSAKEPGPEKIPQGPPDEIFVFNNINFEFDSDFRVLPGALAELKRLNGYLNERGYKAIVVEGHTDFKGTFEYNDDLSLRRARTVRRHLIKRYTLDESKVIAVGYGERRPAVADMSDEGRQMNRRVEVKIYYP